MPHSLTSRASEVVADVDVVVVCGLSQSLAKLCQGCSRTVPGGDGRKQLI